MTAAGSALRLRDSVTGELRAERVVSPKAVTALATMNDGRQVIVGDQSGGVTLIETDALTTAVPRQQLAGPVAAVAPRTETTAVAVLEDGSVLTVDFVKGSAQVSGTIGMRPSAVAVTVDGARLAIGGPIGEIGMWDLESERMGRGAGRRRTGNTSPGVVFSRDGRTLVSTSFDGGVGCGTEPPGSRSPASTSAPISHLLSAPSRRTVPPPWSRPEMARCTGSTPGSIGGPPFACAVAGRNLSAEEWQSVFGDRPYRQTCPTS